MWKERKIIEEKNFYSFVVMCSVEDERDAIVLTSVVWNCSENVYQSMIFVNDPPPKMWCVLGFLSDACCVIIGVQTI